MEITAYNSEKFQRWKLRYVLFTTIITAVVVLSILNDNTVWVIVLFILLWAYFYYSVNNSQLIKITISDKWVIIANKLHPRNMFDGYVIEIESKTQNIKNIVFIGKRWYSVYTINDEDNTIKEFILSLNAYLPMLWTYDQSMLEKVTRRLKL